MGQPTPPPVLEVADVVRRMNDAEGRAPLGRRVVIWSHRKVVKLLRTGGVRILGERRCKKYVMLTDLREAFPEFVDSLLYSEAIAEAANA